MEANKVKIEVSKTDFLDIQELLMRMANNEQNYFGSWRGLPKGTNGYCDGEAFWKLANSFGICHHGENPSPTAKG